MDASNRMDGSPFHQDDGATSVAVAARSHPGAVSRSREIPELTDLVFACRYRPIRTALIGGVLASVFVGIAWSLTEPLYEAEGLVHVREQQDVVFTAQTSRAEDAAFFHSQEKLVLSPQVLSAALHREEMATFAGHLPDHDQVDWLRSRLRADMQSGSEVMTITAAHRSPQLAQALTNAVTGAYLDEVTSRLKRDRELRERELQRAALAADQRLDELWAELNRVAQSVGSDSSQSLTIRDELQFQSYRDYSRQLQAAQLRANELQRQLAVQQSQSKTNLGDAEQVAESMLQDNAEVIAARQRLQSVEQQIQQMRQFAASEDSPRLERLFQQRDLYTSQLSETIEGLRSKIREQSLEQSRKDSEASLAQLQRQIELNRAEKEFFRGRLSEIDTVTLRTDDKSGVQLDMSRHAVDRQTRLADSLWHSLQELRIETQAQPRVTLIDWAQLPQEANNSRQVKAAGAAGVVGCLMAVFAIGYVEWRGCRVRSLNDVTEYTSFPVFGNTAGSGVNVLGLKSKRELSGTREAAAQLVLQSTEGQSAATVMVSSATSSEPRHLVTTDLAAALCQFNQRTLVIDCDASEAKLTQTLGAQRLPGIRQISGDPAEVGRYVVSTDQDGIDFLPLGIDDDQDRWIDARILKLVIESLRQEYQAIIINGPAVVSAAESLLLAAEVDETLLSVFVGMSRWDQLACCERSANQSGVSIGGSILHSGKRTTRLRLIMDRPGRAVSEPSEDATEAELCNQLAEIQNDLGQIRSAPNASQEDIRHNQETSK
jgi:Mrp family chromosome partitioning ATPase